MCEYWSGSENCVAYEDNNVVAFDEPYTQCGMSNPIVVNIADFQVRNSRNTCTRRFVQQPNSVTNYSKTRVLGAGVFWAFDSC